MLCCCLQLSVVDMDILVGRRLANNMEKSYPLLEAAVRDVMFASMIAFSKSSMHSICTSTEHYTSTHCRQVLLNTAFVCPQAILLLRGLR